MLEKLNTVVATEDSISAEKAVGETFDFWEKQLAGVEAGDVVVLRDLNGWDRFVPRVEVPELLERGFKQVESTKSGI